MLDSAYLIDPATALSSKTDVAAADVFVLPASFAQQRLWYVSQWQGATAAYNMPQAKRLQGSLDVTVLTKAAQTIAQRHEILRTHLEFIDQAPMQVITATLSVTIPVIDLAIEASIESDTEQWSQVLALLQSEINQPFDLTQTPLWRLKLFRLSAQDHILFANLHHCIADGWSFDIFWRELMHCYQAIWTGQPLGLPALPIQYADYTLWQQQWVQQERCQTELAYWQQQLQGELPVLQLPNRRSRPAIQTFVGRTARQSLSIELTVALQSLSRSSGSTLFMTLFTAFQVLLHRYSGQEEFVIGTPIAGRNQPEIEGIIGCFVNTLPIRSNLSGNPSFRILLDRLRSVILAAYDHANLPLEKLVEELHFSRDASRSPLFQAMFVLHNTPRSTLELPGLTIKTIALQGRTAKFDLTLTLFETNTGLIAELEYNTDLFDSDTIDRMLSHYHQLLKGIVVNPDQAIDRLPMLSDAERQQLFAWGSPQSVDRTFPDQNACIHQWFEFQAEQTPDAISLTSENQSLTYQELNQRANQLAHYLLAQGVVSETKVGICLTRSLELIVSILAVLKAGGAYVPLDPDYPRDRLLYMVENAKVAVVVTQQSLMQQLSLCVSLIDWQPICLDTKADSIAQQNQTNPVNLSSPNHLAYIIYTSGSTGQPKGVLINHSNVVQLFTAAQPWYQFNDRDVWTLFHSFAFDFSVWEMWGALLHGGRLVIVPYLVSRSPQALYQLLQQEQVTVLNQTPAAFRQLLPVAVAATNANDLNLRYIIFGGESLDLQSLKPWLDRYGDRQPQLVNMYGITETTVHVTYRPITMADISVTAEHPKSTIGFPLPDRQLYLLDAHQQPVPIGIPGELYVGGTGLARGYLNRPDLTAERFIPNPFRALATSPTATSPTASEKLYRTGDLARYLSNGDLEYLGRLDQQVKLRGFRIELGEIEAVISQYPQIRQAIVLLQRNHSDQAGEAYLAAYLVPHPGVKIALTELQQFVRAQLPDYMIPSTFSVLEALPLTAQGKVDRQALQQSHPAKRSSQPSSPAPRNPIEYKLLEIWKEVLGNPAIGLNDNFFELGGHSLLAVRLLTQVEKIFAQSLPLAAIFQNQTIQQLAETLRQAQYAIALGGAAIAPSPMVEFQKGTDKPPLICLPGVFGSFFYCYGLARYMHPNQSIYAIREPGSYGKTVGFSNLEDLAKYYVQIIQSFQPNGPLFLVGYSFGGLVVYEVAQQLVAQGREIRLLALLEPTRPLSPLLRYYFRISAQKGRDLHTLLYYLDLLGVSFAEKLTTALKASISHLLFQPQFMADPLISLQNLSEEQHYLHQYLSTVVRALERYVPPPYPGSIQLFLSDRICQSPKFYQVWRTLTQQEVNIYPITGHHRIIGDEPHVKVLAKQLQNCLDGWAFQNRGRN